MGARFEVDIKSRAARRIGRILLNRPKALNALCDALVKDVTDAIGPFVVPDKIHFVPALPRARSGKLIRRILRSIAEGDPESLGDTSTLADPSAVDDLRDGPMSRVWTIDAEAQS